MGLLYLFKNGSKGTKNPCGNIAKTSEMTFLYSQTYSHFR